MIFGIHKYINPTFRQTHMFFSLHFNCFDQVNLSYIVILYHIASHTIHIILYHILLYISYCIIAYHIVLYHIGSCYIILCRIPENLRIVRDCYKRTLCHLFCRKTLQQHGPWLKCRQTCIAKHSKKVQNKQSANHFHTYIGGFKYPLG